MKMLIYGAGVIGTIYATRFHKIGWDVTLLARGNRLSRLSKGVALIDEMSGEVCKCKLKVIEQLEPEDRYDLIIVPLRNEQIDTVLPVLARNCSPHIMIMVNTAMGYEKWIATVGATRLIVGFPAAGGYIDSEGMVHGFIMRGVYSFLQKTTLGCVDGSLRNYVKDLVTIFKNAGFPAAFCNNMDAWQKTHVALISPIANAIYKNGRSHKQLAASKQDVTTLVLAIREGFGVIEKLGYPVTPSLLSLLFQLPLSVLVASWRFLLKSKFAEIAIAPHANNAEIELKRLADEFQALAVQSSSSIDSIQLFYNAAFGLHAERSRGY